MKNCLIVLLTLPLAACGPPTPTAPAPPPKSEERLQEEDRARMELQLAENALTRGALDCPAACKDVRSMTRAAAWLCPTPSAAAECPEMAARLERGTKIATKDCPPCPESP